MGAWWWVLYGSQALLFLYLFLCLFSAKAPELPLQFVICDLLLFFFLQNARRTVLIRLRSADGCFRGYYSFSGAWVHLGGNMFGDSLVFKLKNKQLVKMAGVSDTNNPTADRRDSTRLNQSRVH